MGKSNGLFLVKSENDYKFIRSAANAPTKLSTAAGEMCKMSWQIKLIVARWARTILYFLTIS